MLFFLVISSFVIFSFPLRSRADTWNPMFPESEEQSNALVYPANGQVLWVPTVYHQVRMYRS